MCIWISRQHKNPKINEDKETLCTNWFGESSDPSMAGPDGNVIGASIDNRKNGVRSVCSIVK